MSPLDPVSDAIESTLTRFAGVLRTIGARYRLPREDLDELVQDVRVRLWRALGAESAGDGAVAVGERIQAIPASYLYRTAGSAAVDLVRRRRARTELSIDEVPVEGESADLEGTPALWVRPHEATDPSDLSTRLGEALATLAEARRAAVSMYLAGYGSNEVAELMGWTEAKARNLVYRGLADLRGRLEALGVGPNAS